MQTTMTQTAILTAWLLGASAAHAAPEADAVASFEKLVTKATSKTELRDIKFSDRLGGWIKGETKIGRPTYDIQRTSSLINPIVADLKFEHETQISDPQESEAAAAEAPLRPATKQRYENRLKYNYTNGAWKLSSAKQCWHIDKRCLTIDIPMEKVVQSAILSGWIP